MNQGPMSTVTFTQAELEKFAELRQQMLDNEAQTGTYTTKAEARQKGCSIHYKFSKQTDVLGGASAFIAITEQAPAKLFWLVDRILMEAGQ